MLPLCTLPVTAAAHPLSAVTSSTSLRHIRIFCSWAHPAVCVFHLLRDDSRPTKKTLRQLLLKSAQTGRTGSTIVLECTNAGQKEGRPRTDSTGGWCTGGLGETDTFLPFLEEWKERCSWWTTGTLTSAWGGHLKGSAHTDHWGYLLGGVIHKSLW